MIGVRLLTIGVKKTGSFRKVGNERIFFRMNNFMNFFSLFKIKSVGISFLIFCYTAIDFSAIGLFLVSVIQIGELF